MRVGFLTSRELVGLTADDRLAIRPLEAEGVSVEAVVWDDPALDLRGFDLAVIRSPWDWYRRAQEFSLVLERLERSGVRLENRGARRWLDKRYLAELGARVVPTRVLSKADSLEEAVRASGWSRIVLKPSVSAGAFRTALFDAADAAEHVALFDQIVREGDAMLQPYVEEIERAGEWSLIFFDGKFSHAVLKRPAGGDFRVQEEFGGRTEFTHPPDALIEEACRALAAAGEDFLYARVDGVVSDARGGFCLTELEVVEPELFLRAHPEAPARFAAAIRRRLG
ncbi:MAG TPA: hypothetical protein VLM85_22015 [Polyangiaceae bacterium]|nr:hypothetical protein [Polyangiaceae bacterium]